MGDRFNTIAEDEIAAEFLRVRGGHFISNLSKNNPYSTYDYLWTIGNEPVFLEIRQRNRPWFAFENFGDVHINSGKLMNLFHYIVRDALGEIRVANIHIARLVCLRQLPEEQSSDQGGTPQL